MDFRRENTSVSLHVQATTTPTWISVPTGKAVTATAMFLGVIIAIFIPIIVFGRLNLDRKRSSFQDKLNLWIARLSCFAAGVFLSTGFLDIFPDVIRAIDEASAKMKIKMSFPLASFFTLIGFFLILSIEQIIMIYKHYLKKVSKNKISPIPSEESQQAFLTNSSHTDGELMSDKNYNNGLKQSYSTDSNLMDHDHFHHENEGHKEGENEDEDEHENILHHSPSRIFALMSAMSVHAIFEGLAVGLGSTVAGVMQLFIALSMHKIIIAASLGLNLATAKLKLTIKIIVSLIFALGSPIGIGLGILIMSQENDHKALYLVAGILEGVACGTFLYVVFFEILPHELGHHSHIDRAGKLFCLLLGFTFVCVYLLLIPEE